MVVLPVLGLLLIAKPASASLSCPTPALVGMQTSQQAFYDVTVDASTGAYTAGTGGSHNITISSGASQNVL
jgi:hypothetical protein